MKLFVWAAGNDINVHAEFQIIFEHRYLWTINLVSEFLEFCTQNLPRKSEFGQAHCEEWFKRIHTKFILNFWTFLPVYTNFEVWNDFWELK
jgi:hypothetical protein